MWQRPWRHFTRTNHDSISIIVPAYNEEQGLEQAVLYTRDSLQSLVLDFEIIIVDDHSSDGTAGIADGIAAVNENIRVVHHPVNKGIGGAFRSGIDHARKEFVMFVPVDNPLGTVDIEAYLKHMDGSDIVVGSRAERVGYTRFAYFASMIYNRILIPLLFNVGISDVNWIQVYRRRLFSEHIIDFNNERIFFLVEILVLARQQNLIITEVPAKMKRRIHGRSTCARPAMMISTLCDMLSFFRRIHCRGNDR
jgi:glycosyltransferase involved in cell wall biosynthesis